MRKPESPVQRPARILYLDYTNKIGLGGGQRSLALLLRNLDRAFFEPVVACPAGERFRQLVDPSVRIVELDLGRRFKELSRFSAGWTSLPGAVASSWSAVCRLRSLIQEWNFDLIHANNLKMCWLALAAARGTHTPIFWHVRDIYPQTVLNATLYRMAAHGASRVIAVSKAVAGQFRTANVEVVYNAVELPAGGMDEMGRQFRHRYSIPVESVVTGYVGRLDGRKGIDTLIEAFARTGLVHQGHRLALVGEGPERNSLALLAAKRGITDAVHLIPYQSDMTSVYSAMDLCVQPSTEPDAFPRSVIEAMSFARAVIGSYTGGIPEAIEEGVTGLCFQPGDVASLTGLIRRLAPSADTVRQMGMAGRLRCERVFSAAGQAERLKRLYLQQLSGAACAQAA
ncbi:MAG: glycosyltransferase family 4 protein [Acidobacteriia bacterium]|nr:glycosyltransferase family 4 protein [Terriglobia bacterium]